MKTKLQKSLKYFAGAAFLFALALNVIVTLDDPFVLMSDSVIAQTTTTTTTTTGTSTDCYPWSPNYNIVTGRCDDPISGEYPEEGDECGYLDLSTGEIEYIGHETKCSWTMDPNLTCQAYPCPF